MRLLESLKVIVPLMLVFGTSSVASQNIGRCVDLLTSIVTSQPFCDAMNVYMKCVVKELNLHNLGLSSSMLQMIQSQMNEQFAKQGQSCDIDIQALVDQVRRDEASGVVETTKKPATFEGATTLGECISALTNAGIASGGVTCSQANEYTKCALRALNFLDSNPGASEIQTFKDQMDGELNKLGLYCDLDVQGIIDELRAEQNGGVTSRPTPRPMTGGPGYGGDTGTAIAPEVVAKCLRDVSNRDDSCEVMKKTSKCVLLHDSNYKKFTDAQLREFERQITSQFSSIDMGFQCDLDMPGIAEELRRENNGANAQLQPLHAVSMAVVTMLSMFIAAIL